MNSDINLQPVSAGILDARPVLSLPTYLLSFEDPSVKKGTVRYFLSTKIEHSPSAVQATGFYVDNMSPEEIALAAQELRDKQDKATYKEIFVPWHRVALIQNLRYKQK